ncbi:MAG TPA: antibiotic biosynthesis monooxygenase [Burkholderiaceae bacterium]|nr:antibiotic biosynthesis monooxygenase [Burkholderiaceae bacterium]
MTVHKALLARIEAKPGKEAAVQDLLTHAVELANQEQRTTVWFALRLGPSSFGVFDAFADDAGRQAHLNGPIAQALAANTPELFRQAPQIDPVDVLAAKLR